MLPIRLTHTPIAPGCKVIGSSSVDMPDGTAMSVIIEMAASEAETVAAFYENEFEEIGLEVSQTVTSGDGESAIMLDGDDRRGRLRLDRHPTRAEKPGPIDSDSG